MGKFLDLVCAFIHLIHLIRTLRPNDYLYCIMTAYRILQRSFFLWRYCKVSYVMTKNLNDKIETESE